MAEETFNICTTGPALAALLHSMALQGQRDYDGLILGQVTSNSSVVLTDAQGPASTVVHSLNITAFCCCTSLRSFYAGNGEVDGSKVAAISGRFPELQVLGWFVCRRGVSLEPSPREETITAGLAALLEEQLGLLLPRRRQQQQEGKQEQQAPLLFAMLAAKQDHEEATLSFQHRIFMQASDHRPSLMPMTLQVRNAGAAMRQTQTYEPVIMPPLLQPSTRRGPAEQGVLTDSSGSKVNLEVAGSKLLHYANSQVKAMEDLYKDMLRRCHDAAKDAVTEMIALQQAKKQVQGAGGSSSKGSSTSGSRH